MNANAKSKDRKYLVFELSGQCKLFSLSSLYVLGSLFLMIPFGAVLMMSFSSHTIPNTLEGGQVFLLSTVGTQWGSILAGMEKIGAVIFCHYPVYTRMFRGE